MFLSGHGLPGEDRRGGDEWKEQAGEGSYTVWGRNRLGEGKEFVISAGCLSLLLVHAVHMGEYLLVLKLYIICRAWV